MSKIGLLVMHYGTPASLDDVLPYYTHIRRGRPPEAAQLQDLVERYQSIGGPSPLNGISKRQAEAIRAGLQSRGVDAVLEIGAKHASPFICDAVRTLMNRGVQKIVGVVLAPHVSNFSVGTYTKEAVAAAVEADPSVSVQVLPRWGTVPAFVQALSARVGKALGSFDPQQTLVVFTAHSLPERILASGDPYKDELLETAKLVAEAANVPHWTFAFQSASQTGEPWLGPDVLDVIRDSQDAYRYIVVCTVGFVSDHLEVLYDLGVEARDLCAELGLGFARADCVNDDPLVMDALAGCLFDLLRD